MQTFGVLVSFAGRAYGYFGPDCILNIVDCGFLDPMGIICDQFSSFGAVAPYAYNLTCSCLHFTLKVYNIDFQQADAERPQSPIAFEFIVGIIFYHKAIFPVSLDQGKVKGHRTFQTYIGHQLCKHQI